RSWSERLHVGGAKALLRRRAERHLAHRHQGEPTHELGRALRLRVEGLDVLERVAEEVEPHRARPPGRVEIENAAAHRVLAGLHDDAGALVSGEIEAFDELVAVDALAGGDVPKRRANEMARGNALQNGVDGGEDERWTSARAGHQPRQRGD